MMHELVDFVDSKHRTESHLALFVDFDDIVDNMAEEVAKDRTISAVLELSDALEDSLCEGRRGRFLIKRVFGDFEALPASENGIQFEFAMHGMETRFVPGVTQTSMSDMALCVDVMETVSACRHVNLFVIATGSRGYLPLVDYLRRQGKIVVLAAFGDLNLPDALKHEKDFLLLDGIRILQNGQRPAAPASAPPSPTRAAFYPARELGEGLCKDALWIIDEFFGKYEEIYLTPLLRRLSEELVTTEEYDPKAVISDLELAGAVRLEKRRGEPYDYTVLILNDEHPDVRALRDDIDRGPDGHDYDSRDGARPENETRAWRTDGYQKQMEEKPSSDY